MANKKKKIIIIGGGLAGLALATELVDARLEVLVIEKNNILGGRAGNSFDKRMKDPIPIGPHVFVTAYNNLRRFLKKIKAKPKIAWERKVFLEVVYNQDHYQFNNNHIPRPFYMLPWLAFYPFINLNDKLSNVKLALLLNFSSNRTIEKYDQVNAYNFLLDLGVTKNAINKFWRFFVLSLLNVPLEMCSATEFSLLLKHWSQLKHRKFGFAKVGLGDIFVDKAESYIKQKEGLLKKNTSIERIIVKGNKIDHLLVSGPGGKRKKIYADFYASTLNPLELRKILSNQMNSTGFFKNLDKFKGVPYISVNIWFNKKISDKKFWALLNDGGRNRPMNTDFYDQSNIYSTRKKQSYITSNIIYSHEYEKLTDGQIIKRTVEEIKQVFPKFDGKVIHSHVHRIPYVIYAPLPGMRKYKLSIKTPISNFYLAGDWISRDLTQCMETAVRSGYRCAEEVLRTIGVNKKICDDSIV